MPGGIGVDADAGARRFAAGGRVADFFSGLLGLGRSRRELGELVFAALGLPPKFRVVSPATVRTVGALLRPLHPRLGQLLPFYATVSTTDLVAPRIGTRRIGEFFRRVAAGK